MAEFSSTLNEDKNINRSDPSRMYSIGQTPLARLRPEKHDDMAIKKEISLIQEICGDIDPDVIALVFHECDYNIQYTIARIKEGNFEDGGWQTAKSNNKKKNHNNNPTDQTVNGSIQSDSERSLSQRTSPTPSLRGGIGGRRRQEHYQYPSSSRPNPGRRGNDFDRNHFIPLSSRHPTRKYPNNTKSIPTQPNPDPIISPSKQKDDITPTPSSSTDEYEFIAGTTQSLTFDNSLKKSPLPSSTKRPIPSSIPQQPVSMHPTIQFSIEPIDIQFGDVQWNDSVPIAVTPSNTPSSPTSITTDHEQEENNLSSNQQTTNDIDTINRLSITNNPIENNLSVVSLGGTSHLSDELNNSSQQQVTSPTNPFISNTNTAPGSNSSAFTPYNTPGNFQSVSKDYTNYKTTPKSTIYPQQPSYQLPPQQQFFLGTYPYHTPAIYPVITSVDPWSTTGFEPYSTYPPTNYIPTYPNQPQYHPATVQPTKYDQHSYDKDFFAHYGQTRLSNTDLSNASQSPKDAPPTSKLSATAASFSQGAPGTAFYLNPILYPLPAYYQDRTISYPSIDNRNGASNRNYYHQQQQRTHNNSTWHSQQ